MSVGPFCGCKGKAKRKPPDFGGHPQPHGIMHMLMALQDLPADMTPVEHVLSGDAPVMLDKEGARMARGPQAHGLSLGRLSALPKSVQKYWC